MQDRSSPHVCDSVGTNQRLECHALVSWGALQRHAVHTCFSLPCVPALLQIQLLIHANTLCLSASDARYVSTS